MKENSLRKRFTVIVSLLICAALVLTCSAFASAFVRASADTVDYNGWHGELAFSNPQFGSVSGGTLPTPSSWSGAAVGGAPSGSVLGGVLRLDEPSSKTSFRMEQYDEYKTERPDSPFGKVTDSQAAGYYEGTNRNVLLINANGIPTAYGFTSESVTLAPSSYYKITVWVKTGSLSNGGGAAILLSGLKDESKGFVNIATPAIKDNDLGWRDYTMYIETGALASADVTLSLQLGRDGAGGLTRGYAMFDNITSSELSTKSFYAETAALTAGVESDRKILISAMESELMTGGDFTVKGEFGEIVRGGQVRAEYLNTASGITEKNNLGFEKGLYAPNDRGGDNTVYAVSTYDTRSGDFVAAYGGIRSDTFTVERFAYYRIGAWYDAYGVEEGDGVNVQVRYRNNGGDTDAEYIDHAPVTNISSDAENANHNGWKELSVYIKGSYFNDYEATVALMLGSESAPSKGVVLFDDVTIQKLTPEQYNSGKDSASGSVEIPGPTDNSGLTNGSFNEVSGYDSLEYDYSYDSEGNVKSKTLTSPLTPSGWVRNFTSDVDSLGYSKASVNTDSIVSGLVPVEEVPVPVSDKLIGNVLKMSSTERTAFNYTGATFTAAASSYNVLRVSLVTDGIDVSSPNENYGVNLVVKDGNRVVSTIEKISASGSYSFYIAGGDKDSTLSLELWLGLNDRVNNLTKLGKGTVYFTSVSYATDSTADVFAERAETYSKTRLASDNANLSFAAVSLGNDDFTQFDTYSSGDTKYPYNWTVAHGAGETVRYGVTLDNGEFVMKLQNVTETYSTLTLDKTYTLSAGGYYTLSVAVKADIPEEFIESDTAVGAYVALTSGDFRFDFKDTRIVEDDTTTEAYRTYTFYIKAPAEESSVAIVLGLGGSDKTNNHTVGSVYLKDIVLTDISNLDYDDAVGSVSSGGLVSSTVMKADLSAVPDADETEDNDEPEVTPEPQGSLEWWLVPSILLAVAVVIAVVGSFIRKRILSRPKKAKVDKTSSYDRRRAAAAAAEAEAKKTAAAAGNVTDSFENFDDTRDSAPDEGPVEVEATEIVPEKVGENADENTGATEEVNAPEGDANANAEETNAETTGEQAAEPETGAAEETPAAENGAEVSGENVAVEQAENANAETGTTEAENANAKTGAAEAENADTKAGAETGAAETTDSPAEPKKSAAPAEKSKKRFVDDFDD